MKRKRPFIEPGELDEFSIVKKRKSRTKRTEIQGPEIDPSKECGDFQVLVEKEIQTASNSKKKGKKGLKPTVDVKISFEPGPSSLDQQGFLKKKKKSKSNINQNGDIGENSEILLNPSNISKVRKKNGLQRREVSESPSDFQPLGQLMKKVKVLKNRNVKCEKFKTKSKAINVKKTVSKPLKKRHSKQAVPEQVIKNENADQILVVKREDSDSRGLHSEHVEKMLKRKKHLQEIAQHEEPPDQETLRPEVLQKKQKKKVRIDETESLKVKKELADTELHFSKRELPAKIIKSKSNKNMTEEVKVSPLTVQALKKDKRALKNVETNKFEIKEEEYDQNYLIKTDELQIKDEVIENEINNETSNSEDSDLEVYYINKNAEKEAKKKLLSPKKHSIMMPKEDQLVLVQRIQNVIPDEDTKSYKYRLQKLDWEKVAFKNYLLEDCKKVWNQLLKKVRHYRLLAEITHDIKKVIELNDLQVTKPRRFKNGNKKHPDMPKRPLTSYFLYYIRKREKIVKDGLELDTLELNKYISEKYQNLPLEKKQKYEDLAAKNREEYKRQMEEFYGKHPEMRKVVIKKPKIKKEKPPTRPENPYRLFMQAELSREEIAEEDKAEFKEVCREKWRQMSDAKKLGWINLAEEKHKYFEEELKEYMALHPEYTPKSHPKSLLSREEINLKDKLAGKPKKPPSTAYSLFISLTLQSDEIGNIPPKKRWIYTSTKWKGMTNDDRDQYKQLLVQVHEQYEKDFKVYLNSLPDDKRQEEILQNMPKKRKNAATDKPSTSGRNTKTSINKSQPPRRKSVTSSTTTKPKLQMPIAPPRSAFKYFAEKHQGENSKEAWKILDVVEKEKHEKELSILKDKYIKEFEAFLKGLSKDELAAFCANRNSRADCSSSEESDDESEHDDHEESSGDSSDNSESDNESDEN